jgi:outer membrane protein assembly factor BamB/tetratricopeptide (TPR) repeat protein
MALRWLKISSLVFTALAILLQHLMSEGSHAMSRAPRTVAVVLSVLVFTASGRAAPPVEIIGPAVDAKVTKRLEAARDLIQEENWPQVVKLVQGLLDADQDVLVTGKDGKPVPARTEANRLLRGLPAKGMAFYRLTYGGVARELLKEARDKSDPKRLAVLGRRFANLGPGLEALELLASFHFDVGHPALGALLQGLPPPPGADRPDGDYLLRAARGYDQILEASGSARQWQPATVFKAVAAFRLVGERAKSDRLWKQLAARIGTDGLKAGAGRLSVAKLQGEIDRLPVWSISGDLWSYSQGTGGVPFLQRRWMQQTVAQNLDARRLIEQTVRTLQQRRQAVVPAFYPIAATVDVPRRGEVPILVYRSHLGLHGIGINSGKLIWENESVWGLERMFVDSDKRKAIKEWQKEYRTVGRDDVVLDNSVLGMLSTDGQRVFAVEDFAVPPQDVESLDEKTYGKLVDDAAHHNRLQAFDLASGKLLWELGGRGKGKLDDSFFLGVPLPLGGRLYVLNEKEQEIRLVCLEPKRGKLDWLLPLAKVRPGLPRDIWRRTWAAPLAYSNGILICPTNTGAVIGVDVQARGVVWGHVYRDKEVNRVAGIWKVSAPVVADGNVVFTAPDADSIHCLDLFNGSLRWKVKMQSDDLYLAGVHGDKVVIVDTDQCRALGLKDGKTAWSVQTGLPSGRGVAAGDLYYLPLQAAAKTKEPEVCVINLVKGGIVAHAKSRLREVAGNLLFYDGLVLSQTATEIVSYPQLNAMLKELDVVLARDPPNNPVALVARAEFRLDRGDFKGAIDDLQAALANKPPEELLLKARNKLYDALTELIKLDFDAGEKHLDEYKLLIDPVIPQGASPAARLALEEEGRRRRVNYLLVVARVHEKRGKVVEALSDYLDIADKAERHELFSTLDDPASKATPTAWAHGRIAALIARATPEQRKLLEADIQKRWQAIRKSKDTKAMRQFVEIFGSDSSQGREARFELAELLLAKKGSGWFLDAQQQLLILRRQTEDRKLAGRAVEALARVTLAKGLVEDAVYYYRVLGREFAKDVIRDDKTGAELLEAIATDKRFLPFLVEPPKWGKIRGEQEEGKGAQASPLFFFGHDGEKLPFLQRNRVALKVDWHQLRLVDRRTNEERWSMNLDRTDIAKFMDGGIEGFRPRLACQAVGHVVVVPIAHRVFGIDPVNPRVLWKRSLNDELSAGKRRSERVDPRDGQLIIEYENGFEHKLGGLSVVQSTHVCLLTHDGLLALDPVTGLTLWTRSDVNARSELFGDAEHVYVVEVDAEGKARQTRGLRASDGMSVKTPDFTAAYQRRVRVLGGRILTVDADTKDKMALRLYNVQTGKDVWKRTFQAGAMVLRSLAPHLTGVVEPDGAATILDLAGKDLARVKLDPKHIHKAQAIHLLQDDMNYYLAINGPKVRPTQPYVTAASGIRTVPLNGWFYAIDRGKGSIRWTCKPDAQMLVVDDFRALPIILCTARNADRAALLAVDKRSGKLVMDKDQSIRRISPFHALRVDPAAGKIELISEDLKVTFTSVHGRPRQ